MPPISRQKVNLKTKIINQIKMINIIKNLALIKKHTISNFIRWMPKIRKKIRISCKKKLKKKKLVATSSKKDRKFAMYVRQICKNMRSIFIHAIVNIKYAISAISIKLIIMKENALIVISTTKFRESKNINKIDLRKIRHNRNNNFKKILNYICEMRTRI